MNEAQLASMLVECTPYNEDVTKTIARFRGDVCKTGIDAEALWDKHTRSIKPCVECKAPVCEAHGPVCAMCGAHCCKECYDDRKGMTYARTSQGSRAVFLCRAHIASCHAQCLAITIASPVDFRPPARCGGCDRIACIIHSSYNVTTQRVACVGCSGVCAGCEKPFWTSPASYTWSHDDRGFCAECWGKRYKRAKRA